jgi:hypothetical protein
MPFTPAQIAAAGKASIDYFLKNDPIDQINIVHPLLKKLGEAKKPYAGALQYVTEQLRFTNDSNFQSYFGAGQVTFNNKNTLDQAKYSWGSFHDGFGLNEDQLAQNGITVTDEKNQVASDAERMQLTNILEENTETLKLGFEENFDLMIHRDGTQSSTDIPGLDHLVSLTPSSGTVGALAASNAWWQNYADLTLGSTAGEFLDKMEAAWRACIKYGQSIPDFILAGADFIDAYRNACGAPGGAIQRQVTVSGKGGTTLDGSVGTGIQTGLYFKGVELIWDPVFDLLDTLDSPTISWASRCYFLNTRFLKLRPIAGHWMVSRRPPRVFDRYVHYWALTSKAALTTGKRNAHAVLALAA